MTCIESDCEQPRLVMPDNVALSTRWSAGHEFVCVDSNPNGRTATPWCGDHFPNWLWGTHRVPRIHKPQQSRVYGGMTDRMAEAITEAATAVRRITEPAESLAEDYQEFVEAYEGELS